MLSSDTETTTVSKIISSTPINPIITGGTESLVLNSLPAPLTAPTGWRSEVIHSNETVNLTNTGTTSYGGYNTINADYSTINTGYNTGFDTLNTAYNTSNSSYNQNSSGVFNDITNEYLNTTVNNNLLNQNQSVFTQEQQRNIVNLVENQQPPPVVVRKTLPNNAVTYQQNVSVRYLRPPTPPPPGPLIIREVRPPPPRPRSPIQIRQRPPPPPTPPPLVLRERPPPPPPQTPAKVVDKLLPPLPQPARRLIVERYGPCPPKPQDVVVERWLPYQKPPPRRVLLERASAPLIPVQEPNLLILHDSPHAQVRRQYIDQGVVRADPNDYLRRYGGELTVGTSGSRYGYLVDEATRAVPPPLAPIISSSDHHYRRSYVDDYYHRAPSPYVHETWERTRVVSPIPRSSSYHYGRSYYDSPYYHDYIDYDSSHHYCNQSPRRYSYDSYGYYDDYYPRYHGSYRTMVDVTPTWNGYCNSSRYDPYYRSSSYYEPYDRYSSYYPSNTIRVRSDGELHHVLSDLTYGRVPSPLLDPYY